MAVSVTILGSTGVIGVHTLEIIREFPGEFTVAALCAGRNAERLAEQIREFRPGFVSVQDEETRDKLLSLLSGMDPLPDVGIGRDGMLDAARVSSDVVVTAVVGAVGLEPTWHAISRGATIALANKETLVAAGDLVMPHAEACGARILPVDSEHSALFQCLQDNARKDVRRFILTASGGPFRTWSGADMETATVEQALRHPNWVMGRKLTVDSATMMNKGLEVIEAHHLFNARYDDIDVMVHPQSVVHSLVEYNDGSVMAQMATPDMRLPIQYALMYPSRPANPWPRLDLLACGSLTFEAPDFDRFTCLRLAFAAGRSGGYAPCVMNAANEIAVAAFLEGRIPFGAIAQIVESVLTSHISGTPHELNDIVEMDNWARLQARTTVLESRWMR